jgi:hypothetical protein
MNAAFLSFPQSVHAVLVHTGLMEPEAAPKPKRKRPKPAKREHSLIDVAQEFAAEEQCSGHLCQVYNRSFVSWR